MQTYSVKADYPIAIQYIGFDQGAVTINSNADVLMNGAIFNRDGDTTVTSGAGAIAQLGSSALISGNNVSLSAASGIGDASQAVDVQLAGGRLDATTSSGDIHLQQAVGDLHVGTIGGRGAGLVRLTAEGSLLGADTTSSVQGKRVELAATNGGIGVLDGSRDTPLVVRTGYSSDTAQWVDLGLAATARDNIFLRNLGDAGAAAVFSGNLLLVAVESLAGDVRIETSGTLIDNNPSGAPTSAPSMSSLRCGIRCACGQPRGRQGRRAGGKLRGRGHAGLSHLLEPSKSPGEVRPATMRTTASS